MAELGKKIDEQALAKLTKDLENELANNRNSKSYAKLKSNQQVLADLFSDDTYVSHNTKEGLEKTKAALQKEISEREAKKGAMPEYVNAMKKDLETIEYRLTHLEKLNDTNIFEVNSTGELLVDDIFLKTSGDITRTGIDVNHAGMTLGGKEVKVLGVDKNKKGNLLCNIDGQDFTISHEGDKLSVIPSTILLKGSLEISILGVYGKEESGNITKRVGQDKKVIIKASPEDQKAFKEQDDAATMQAITAIDAVQNISGKTIDAFINDQVGLFNAFDKIFLAHDATKLYWKHLNSEQKKLFIDDLLRSHTGFLGGMLFNIDDAKKTFFDAVLTYKYSATEPKTILEMQDVFIGFHKNKVIQNIVSDALHQTLHKKIASNADDTVKNNLAKFYAKYSTKQVSEFDLFYNKLENDQTGAFTKIKEAFESVKQDSMFEAFKDAMRSNPHVQAEKINGEGVWENIPGDQQKRFSMQMVFQNSQDVTYPTRNRIQYIPALHADGILSLETFLETFKDEIATLAKQETDQTKLRGNIKTLILSKLSDQAIKDVLKKKLLNTFGDKISQNISGGSTNILNEMNKFAIDEKAFQQGYKKTYIDNNTPQTPIDSTSTGTQNGTFPASNPSNYVRPSNKIKVAISDVSAVYKDQAEHAGAESVREEYNALGKLKLFDTGTYHFWKRAKLFLFREEKKNKVMEEKMAEYETQGVETKRGDLTAAADRHMREFMEKNSKVKAILTDVEDPEINKLGTAYLEAATPMSDQEFENSFNAIVAKNKELSKALEKGDIKHSASNALLSLRAQRSHNVMIHDSINAIEQFATNHDQEKYQATMKKITSDYIAQTHNAMPDLVKDALKASVTDLDKYRRLLRNELAVASVNAKTTQIVIDVLTKGGASYGVDMTDKKGSIFVKFGTWCRQHPKSAIAIGAAISVGAGVFTGGLGAFATGAVVAKSGLFLGGRKASDMTEERKGQEEKLVRGLSNETEKLNGRKHIIKNSNGLQKMALGTDRYHAVRQGQLYANTSHYAKIAETKKIIDTLQEMLTSGVCDPSIVADALARTDYHLQSGHNFLGQQDDKDMEENMNILQRLTRAGIHTLGMTISDMRKESSYTNAKALLEKEYTNTHKVFKKQRTILGLKYGALGAALSFGMRQLAGSPHHNTTPDAIKPDIPSTSDSATSAVSKTTTKLPNIYASDFDANSNHHTMFKLGTGPKVGLTPTTDFVGMTPSQLMDRITQVDPMNSKLVQNITRHMVTTGELSADQVNNTIGAVAKLVAGEGIPPSQYMQDHISRYLYHVLERDAVLSQAMDAAGDTVKEEIKKKLIDGGVGQKGFLDAFLQGGKTAGQYIVNVLTATSPLFANTFLGNPDFVLPDKNGKLPGEQGYIPPKTTVDPNKKPIVGGRFDDKVMADWLIDDTKSSPTHETKDKTSTDTTSPNDDVNKTLSAIDDEAKKTQELIQQKFHTEMKASIDPLIARYNGWLKVYADIKNEFESAKNETDLVKKVKILESLKNRTQGLQKSIQGVKDLADEKFIFFKKKYDELPDEVRKYTKIDMTKLQTMRRDGQNTLRELHSFIVSLQQLIDDSNDAGTTTSSKSPTPPLPTPPSPTSTSKKPVIKTASALSKKIILPSSSTLKKSVKVPLTPASASTVYKPAKVIDRLNAIKIPDAKLSSDIYHTEIEKAYFSYINILKLIEQKQIEVRSNDIEKIEDDLIKGKDIHQDRIDYMNANFAYLHDIGSQFVKSFSTFIDQTPLDDEHKDFERIYELGNQVAERLQRFVKFDSALIGRVDKINNAYKKKVVSPAVVSTPVASSAPASKAAVVSTSAGTINDTTILEQFKKLKGSNKILSIKKHDDKALYQLYKDFLKDPENAKNYNITPVPNKVKEIAIIGVFDTTTNTWIGQAPTT